MAVDSCLSGFKSDKLIILKVCQPRVITHIAPPGYKNVRCEGASRIDLRITSSWCQNKTKISSYNRDQFLSFFLEEWYKFCTRISRPSDVETMIVALIVFGSQSQPDRQLLIKLLSVSAFYILSRTLLPFHLVQISRSKKKSVKIGPSQDVVFWLVEISSSWPLIGQHVAQWDRWF